MNDPWRFIAFPVSAIIGYLLSLGITTQFSTVTGMGEFASRLTVIAIAGFFAGFLVDEVIPTYLKAVRQNRGGFGGSGGSSDFGGDFDDEDLDLD